MVRRVLCVSLRGLAEASVRTLSVLFWLSSSMVYGSAYAADCETPYSTDQLLTDLIEAEELLKTEDKGAILSKAKGMESGLSCMTETLPPILIGRVCDRCGWVVLCG